MSFARDVDACARITAALLELPAFKTIRSIESLLEELSFGQWVNTAANVRAQTDSLVANCAASPRQLHELIRTVVLLHGLEPRQLAGLGSCLDGILARSIRFLEWYALDRALDAMVPPLPDAAVRQAFKGVLPYDLLSSDPRQPAWQHAVEQLSEKNLSEEPESSHPLFRFLERCRPHLSAPTAASIADWENSVAARLGRTLHHLRGKGSGSSPAAAAASPDAFAPTHRLQIVAAQPMESDPDHPVYRIRAWLRRSDAATAPVPVRHPALRDEGQPAADLPQLLPELALVARSLAPDGSLVIEVALPLELLSMDLETAPWPPDTTRTSGEVVPVLIRSLDRLPTADRPVHSGHSSKWTRLGTAVSAHDTAWAEDGDDPAEALAFFSLGPLEIASATPVVYLKSIVVDHSIPLAVWLRERPRKRGTARTLLTQKLIGTDPARWPEEVLQLRAGRDRALPAFSVLWDDPTTAPPVAAPLALPADPVA